MNRRPVIPEQTDNTVERWMEEQRQRAIERQARGEQQRQEAVREAVRRAAAQEAVREAVRLSAAQDVTDADAVPELPDGPSDSQALIAEVCDEFKDFLIRKNQQYGDSAIDPVRVFSKVGPEEQLKVRMDDKLSRLVRGDDSLEPDEDIITDLLGYWILLQVVRRKAARADA
jgi:predicted secreted acid phosphatase